MLGFLEDGLRRMHVGANRVEFLKELWSRRDESWAWQEARSAVDSEETPRQPSFMGATPTGGF